MNFKNFKLQVILRFILVTAGIYGIVYYSYIELNYIRLFFLGLFVVLVLSSLFYYLNKTNKDTLYFLNSILHNDFSFKYARDEKGKSYNALYQAFNQVNQKFIESTQSEASEYQYIVTLISQMQIGVLIYDDKKRVHLVNESFTTLIERDQLIDLDGVKKSNSDLYECILSLESGNKTTLKTSINNQLHEFSIAASSLKMKQRRYKIISVQDIKNELDINEMQAWHKLIRVLTHEIMNSVSPIASLSSSMQGLVADSDQHETVNEGLEAIEHRSRSLLAFTESYRKLTRVPIPSFQDIEASAFFDKILKLVQPEFEKNDKLIHLNQDHPEIRFKADPILLEQVLINLIKNGMEAIEEGGLVEVNCSSLGGKTEIIVKDNGSGIPIGIQEQVFIPFYTTKPEGSGIGLSLSRQIINEHNGTLTFHSNEKGTSFKISL